MVVHQHSLTFEVLWTALSSSWPSVRPVGGVSGARQRRVIHWCLWALWRCSVCVTHLISAALGLLFLDVHGQHLAAEREALGLLNHLLVRRYGVVSHDNMTLERVDQIGQRTHNEANKLITFGFKDRPFYVHHTQVARFSFTSTAGISG